MLNNVSLMGRLVADPVIQTVLKEGKETVIARYRLAVGRDYKAGDVYPADFIPCKAFGPNACFTRDYLHKGDLININGRIVSEPYKKEGEEHTLFFTGIQVNKTYLCQRKLEEKQHTRAMTPAQDGERQSKENQERESREQQPVQAEEPSNLPPILEEEYYDLPPLPEEEYYGLPDGMDLDPIFGS